MRLEFVAVWGSDYDIAGIDKHRTTFDLFEM